MPITALQITLYETTDKTQFDSKEAAEAHEAVYQLAQELEASEIYWRDTSAYEVAEWLLQNYTLTRKDLNANCI